MALRTLVSWGWSPILITATAVTGYLMEWPLALVAPIMGVLLIIGLVLAVISAGERESEKAVIRLRYLAGYFNRRFMGESSLSIFAIINSLFKTDNTKLWEWARACDMSQRVFNSWSSGLINRLETDTRAGRFGAYLRIYLTELWQMNSIYQEFADQFYEIAEKVEVPPETLEQYNKFTAEYNVFVQNFRACIADLLKAGKTELEPPSVKMAQELRQMARAGNFEPRA